MVATQHVHDKNHLGMIIHQETTFAQTFEGQILALEEELSLSLDNLEEPVDCDVSPIVNSSVAPTALAANNTPGGNGSDDDDIPQLILGWGV